MRIIKYQDRPFDFKEIGFDLPQVKISLGGLNTEVRTIESAGECAKAIDYFQYNICQKMSTSMYRQSYTEEEQKMHYKTIFSAHYLIFKLRTTLEAFKNDPQGQKSNLDSIIKKIQNLTIEPDTEEKTDKVRQAVADVFNKPKLRMNLKSLQSRG